MVIDPEEAEAIIAHHEALTLEEGWRWAKDGVLFNPMYLDLEGPGGRPTVVAQHALKDNERAEILEIRGALLYRDEEGRMHVYPVVWRWAVQYCPGWEEGCTVFGNHMHEFYSGAIIGDPIVAPDGEPYDGDFDADWLAVHAVSASRKIAAPCWAVGPKRLIRDMYPPALHPGDEPMAGTIFHNQYPITDRGPGFTAWKPGQEPTIGSMPIPRTWKTS